MTDPFLTDLQVKLVRLETAKRTLDKAIQDAVDSVQAAQKELNDLRDEHKKECAREGL